MRVYRIPGARVSLVVEGMEKGDVESYIVVSEYVDEVLISDQLTTDLLPALKGRVFPLGLGGLGLPGR